MTKKKSPHARSCPCGSGDALRACCGPLHDGAEPADPAALVRSRFAAFALGRADYLWRTLHSTHPLRARPEGDVLRELRQAHERLRYLGVQVHDVRVEGTHAQVLFGVRVFQHGNDSSFVELSDFEWEDGWRYVGGVTRAARELPSPRFADFASDA